MYTKRLRSAAAVFATLLAMAYTIWDARSSGAAATRSTAMLILLVSIYFAVEEICQILKDMRDRPNDQTTEARPSVLGPR